MSKGKCSSLRQSWKQLQSDGHPSLYTLLNFRLFSVRYYCSIVSITYSTFICSIIDIFSLIITSNALALKRFQGISFHSTVHLKGSIRLTILFLLTHNVFAKTGLKRNIYKHSAIFHSNISSINIRKYIFMFLNNFIIYNKTHQHNVSTIIVDNKSSSIIPINYTIAHIISFVFSLLHESNFYEYYCNQSNLKLHVSLALPFLNAKLHCIHGRISSTISL